ncbi:MAG: TRAP transporter substrate-binding protein, partial [Pseudomonadota bacterium]|nr:TRAP transporter substrate-binding protein [Pseudomonadota bacterium]
ITEAVRLDKVPAGYTWLGYDQGRTPAAPLFGAVPFGLSPWAYLAWWYEGEGEQLARGVYHDQGLHPILCGLIGPETAGWFRKPIDTVEDLEGLKIRFAGLGGKTLQALGASVTMIPGSDLFQALEKGAIDATEYSLPVVDEKLGFPRVAPINYFPGWHQPFTAFHLVVNLQRWNRLAPATRSALETACTAGVTRNLARAEGLQGAVLERFQKEGVDTRVLNPALLETLRTAAQTVLAEEAAADPTFARVYANQQRFAERYAVWDALAYPPNAAP